MSNNIDAGALNFPVFGVDITISSPDLSAKLVVTGVDLTTSAEKAIFRNGVGDTRARVWYDIGQVNTVKLDATVIGTDATGAGGNNNPGAALGLKVGDAVQLASTTGKYPSVAGNWRVDDITSTGTNTGFAAWSISLVPEVT